MGKGWKQAGKQENAAKKGKMFTKVAREIAVAAKLGGPDPESNGRLKLAIVAARAISCPNDTIERAIKRGSGQDSDASAIEELTYEGLGPHGIGIVVEVQTDNRNRAVSEIRNIFRKHDGNLGESGSVAWMFDRVTEVIGEKSVVEDPEAEAIEVGANEVEKNDDGTYSFIGELSDFDALRTQLQGRGWAVKSAARVYRPKNYTELGGPERQEVGELLDALDDCDDTQKIYSTLA
jgi:YebC/PmpR family DNA-binding regulatory protein